MRGNNPAMRAKTGRCIKNSSESSENINLIDKDGGAGVVTVISKFTVIQCTYFRVVSAN